jgi:hypothetical protein
VVASFDGGDYLRAPSPEGWALAPSAPQRCSAELLEGIAALFREHGLPVLTRGYETFVALGFSRTVAPGKAVQVRLGNGKRLGRSERLSSPPPLIGSTGYALRRKSAARTRLRNCSGVLGGVSIGG